MIFGKGLVESPVDKRDVLFSSVCPDVKRIPEECPAPFDLEILNQGSKPHCVGFSCAAIKQEKELRERVAKTFDGDWIYNECKKIDGIPNVPGTYLRAGMKILQKQGCKPLNGQETEARVFRTGGYAMADDKSLYGLKRAIFINGALLAGFRGSNEGWATPYIRPPKQGEALWSHAVSLIGYTKTHIIGQNSWGQGWGDKGLFYVDENALTALFESWAILTDLPTEQLDVDNSGWVAIDWIDINPAPGSQGTVTANLNFRKEPNGERIETLLKGQGVEILSEKIKAGNYNWIKVRKA